jgi:hypothetical protein
MPAKVPWVSADSETSACCCGCSIFEANDTIYLTISGWSGCQGCEPEPFTGHYANLVSLNGVWELTPTFPGATSFEAYIPAAAEIIIYTNPGCDNEIIDTFIEDYRIVVSCNSFAGEIIVQVYGMTTALSAFLGSVAIGSPMTISNTTECSYVGQSAGVGGAATIDFP